jgi:two-component system NarL family sensor kinase
MLGYGVADLVGRSLADLAFDGWQDAAGVASSRLRYGATNPFELALRGRSGRRSLIEMTRGSSAHLVPDGQVCLLWEERRGAARKADRAELEQQWQVVYELLQRQERERQQTVNTLHDTLVPTAVMAKYLLESASRTFDSSSDARLQAPLRQACQLLRDLLDGMRGISDSLRPRMLDDLGLYAALERLVQEQFSAPGAPRVQCAWRAPESDIPPSLRADIFRIVEAALSNVQAHAQASSATVSVAVVQSELRVFIEDDGLGFDVRPLGLVSESLPGEWHHPTPQSRGVALGLNAMCRRVHAHGGRFVLESHGHRPLGVLVGGIWPVSV